MKEAGESITECAEEIKETVKEAVKESVAGWLTGNGYADVNEVFTAEKTDGDITALIAEFRNISWHT